ncbi:hypothetical protein GLYMA_04G133500v4 [Glycine max]|uniref:Uncharacterized protein n=2 Tax=Glycine subgen. Soja TaxID=1462606 RepID=K7KJY3_SOYBN|nr:hypothetical protein JHK87_009858 [Glycine soja]KAG5049161.1 hypothetical protein JHK85_010264 [Glycine max]KAH1111200.1 hypothetical protein GYH30_009822 [Glycine max]KHN12333.1 hypothetical protein glysoja_034425 [Glycine soja]KRH62806.1 hypothetical protein GLYMA_04G133500v4 [Glycine max]
MFFPFSLSFITVSCFFFSHHKLQPLLFTLLKNGFHHFQLDTHKNFPNSRL